MTLQEMFTQMKNGQVAAHSELGTRDETKQSKSYSGRLRPLKASVGLKAHILLMKDLVIPFNPFTGSPDDVYNAKTPFRPILLVSQALAIIKQACNEDADLAAKWCRLLGSDNINWKAAPSMDDYYLFKARGYIKPRVMSYSTVRLSFGGKGGFSEFAQKFTVDPTELDENNNYSTDTPPLHHQGAIFFNSMAKAEADEICAAMSKQGATKEQVAAQRRTVYSKVPIGFVNQTNLVPFLYLPMNETPPVLDPERPGELESCIRWMTLNQDKFGTALDEVAKDNQLDENMDYYDFTYKTPSASQTKSNGQVFTDDDALELYKALTITVSDSRSGVWGGTSTIDGKSVANADLYAGVFKTTEAYFLYSQGQSETAGGDTFEKLMAASNRFRPISTVADKLLTASNQAFLADFAESKYFTEGVKKANATFFAAMNASNALALAEYEEEELEEAATESMKSLDSLISDARVVDGDSIAELQLSDG